MKYLLIIAGVLLIVLTIAAGLIWVKHVCSLYGRIAMGLTGWVLQVCSRY